VRGLLGVVVLNIQTAGDHWKEKLDNKSYQICDVKLGIL
jgi:hypothetical protein